MKREAVKRFISWCEAEIDRLEHGENTNANVYDSKTDVSEKSKTESNGKQKLLEKKKAKQRQAAKAKVGSSYTVIKMKK